MKTFPVSLIISFYNKIDYLKLIFAALERQSFRDFEVIIADDGSKPEVVEEIRQIMEHAPLTIQHLWHEDQGFRKTMIFNEAIRKSRSPYLIFMDGDCVPHSRFVEEHYKNRQPNVLLAGRRVYLSEKLSKSLDPEKIKDGYLEKVGFIITLLADGIFGRSSHVVKGIYVGNPLLRKFLNRAMKGVLGSNFSVHKSDLEAINGFDERYEAPAVGEDSDIELRLVWNNVEIRMVKNMAVQYHIHHKKLPRPQKNLEIFEAVKKEGQAFTPYGLVQPDNRDTNYVQKG
ncbi:MAG TPA: glycosyltransferase [Chryseosolibacter sp.]|jgi:Glycosyltransferases, probably involved in cell wall biogenesis